MKTDRFLAKVDRNHVSWSTGRKNHFEVLRVPTNTFISPSRFGFRALFCVPIILQLVLIEGMMVFREKKLTVDVEDE
jgi:hypothetical protein